VTWRLVDLEHTDLCCGEGKKGFTVRDCGAKTAAREYQSIIVADTGPLKDSGATVDL
jgi:hypothetical protein